MKKLKIMSSVMGTVICAAVLFTGCESEPDAITEANATLKAELMANTELPAFIKTTGETIEAVYRGKSVTLFKIDKEHYLYEGDIVLNRSQFTLPGEEERGTYNGLEWTNRTVRYSYAKGRYKPNAATIAAWEGAMQAWEDDLGFTFIEVNNRFRGDYIQVQSNSNGQAYSTSIGRDGGRQIISFDSRYFTTGSMIHEIGHAVGLEHEQKRPDADEYIIINWSNIRPGSPAYQFEPCSAGCVGDGEFDFQSIMLYPATGYNSEWVYNTSIPAMTTLDGGIWTSQRDYLSDGDIAAINAMYN